MNFSFTTMTHPQTAAQQSFHNRLVRKAQSRPASRRLNITAGQLQPIPIPVPVTGPRRVPTSPVPNRMPVQQTEIQTPKETETSVALKDMTPLGQAVFKSDAERVASLLSTLSSAEVNKPDANGFSPLAVAVRYGNDRIVQRLLDDPKIDVNQPNRDQRTPIILAARYGRLPILRALLKAPQINLNTQDKDKLTALDWCLRQHNNEGIKLLKAAGAESITYK